MSSEQEQFQAHLKERGFVLVKDENYEDTERALRRLIAAAKARCSPYPPDGADKELAAATKQAESLFNPHPTD